MKQLESLYRRTKESLSATHRNHPDEGIDIIKEVQHDIKILRVDNPEISDQLSTLEVIALNNLACAYNKKGKYKAGLFNLQLARSIQQKIFPDIGITKNPQTLHQVATTHSNMCAILSQMGQHQKALKQIYSAIELLLRNKQTAASDALIVFFYNSAIQNQYLNKLNDSKKQAQKGYSISKSNQEMRKKFSDVINRIDEKIKAREEKIGNYLMNQYKNRTISNSLHNISSDTTNSKIIMKQFSTYQARLPKFSPPRHQNNPGFPSVKLPRNLRSSKQMKRQGFSLGIESRKKVLSLYNTTVLIPPKNKRSLSKKKDTLQKLSLFKDQ